VFCLARELGNPTVVSSDYYKKGKEKEKMKVSFTSRRFFWSSFINSWSNKTRFCLGYFSFSPESKVVVILMPPVALSGEIQT